MGAKVHIHSRTMFFNLSLWISHQFKFTVLLIFLLCLTINIQKGLLILCGFHKYFWTA